MKHNDMKNKTVLEDCIEELKKLKPEWNRESFHECHHSIWKGPLVDGVDLQMLRMFIRCRERFRIRYVCGLIELHEFDPCWVYPEVFKVGVIAAHKGLSPASKMIAYSEHLINDYPKHHQELHQLIRIAEQQALIYHDWTRKLRKPQRVPVDLPRQLKVKITLPSGRDVTMVGTFDDLMLIRDIRGDNLFQLTSKTCEVVDIAAFDKIAIGITARYFLPLQFHTFVLSQAVLDPNTSPLRNSLKSGASYSWLSEYNLVKRPQSERFPLRQKTSETLDQFTTRIIDNFTANHESYFYDYPKTSLTKHFLMLCLYPILEQLCDWWTEIKKSIDIYDESTIAKGIHYMTPWGVDTYSGGLYAEKITGEGFRMSSRETELFDYPGKEIQ